MRNTLLALLSCAMIALSLGVTGHAEATSQIERGAASDGIVVDASPSNVVSPRTHVVYNFARRTAALVVIDVHRQTVRVASVVDLDVVTKQP